MEEIWKPVPRYEEYYEVSNLGRVKRTKSGIGTQSGRILKGYTDPDGYKRVDLTVNNKSKGFFVHRLVATAFLSNPENKPQVNHIDGNKQNNNISNLEWVTQEQNMAHAWRIGLTKGNTGKHFTHHKHQEL